MGMVEGTTDRKTLTTVITASSVGTVIEWYDFYIFGALATIISTQFFPKTDPTASFLSTLAIFAVGFVVRPFGAVFFGRLGDLVGRKATFLITLVMMGVSTFLVGCLPTYGQVGILAPILLTILRLFQGLALGGEYGGAATFVAEHAPANRRGYYTSFIQITATAGLVMSLLVIMFVRNSMPKEAFEGWGWRIPFLISSVLIVFSYFIRLKMHESPLFANLKARGKTSANPLRESFVNPENRKWVLIALFGATAGQGVVWYTGQFYAMTFMQKTLKVNPALVEQIMLIGLVAATPLFVLFGHLSDKIGRKKIMMAGLALAAVAYVPLFMGLASLAGPIPTAKDAFIQSVPVLPMAGIIFLMVVFVTMVYGPIAAFLVEIFPTRIRYTSLSVPYHIGNGIFGGLVPLIATAVVTKTGNIFASLVYPIGIAVITLIVGSICLPEKTDQMHAEEPA